MVSLVSQVTIFFVGLFVFARAGKIGETFEDPTLGRPHVDSLKGTDKVKNLKELRVQHKGKQYRVFFAFDPLRQAVMLCGGDKSGNKHFYETMIPIAESELLNYLQELE